MGAQSVWGANAMKPRMCPRTFKRNKIKRDISAEEQKGREVYHRADGLTASKDVPHRMLSKYTTCDVFCAAL